MLSARRSSPLAAALFVGAVACAPRAVPLAGVPTPARLPTGELPAGHHRIVFTWQYTESEISAKGEGLARIAAPDSVRLDFFLSGGMGSSTTILIGDTLDVPGGDLFKRYIPPVPLLWATLGRLRVPAVADTTARVDGDTLRADIGTKHRWRVAFVGDRLVRVERIDDGRVRELVTRAPNDNVRYDDLAGRRTLKLTVSRNEAVPAFDPQIWKR